MNIENPETIEIQGLKTIHKLCKFGADNNMEGCSFTEIVERMFLALKKLEGCVVVAERTSGFYIQDLRNPIGNCMKFWYKSGYGTKHKNFFWCATYEEAQEYAGGCDWFKIWYAPYIDTLIEHTVDMQHADRVREKAMVEAARGGYE